MKRRWAIIAAALASVTMPAQAAPKNDDKDLVALWYRAFESKDSSIFDRILSDAWQDVPSAEDAPAGPPGAKAALMKLTGTFPDLTIQIEDVLQDGNKVVVRSKISGSLRRPFLGVPANGQNLSIQAIDIHEVQGGKIIRTWHTEDWMTGFRQLGVLGR